MKCIREESIQKYIDNETTPTEDDYINSHHKECTKCAEKIEFMRQTADQIKNSISLVDEADIEIPEFNESLQHKKISNGNLKKIIYVASAACILLLFFFLFQKQEEEADLVFSYDMEIDFNANLPASEQEMVIQIIDSKGKLVNYQIY